MSSTMKHVQWIMTNVQNLFNLIAVFSRKVCIYNITVLYYHATHSKVLKRTGRGRVYNMTIPIKASESTSNYPKNMKNISKTA